MMAHFWKYKVSAGEPFRPSPVINYICVLTAEEVKVKITSAIQTYLCQNVPSILVQYWAAKKTRNTYVLTTTCQPFGVFGDNEELQAYRKACLDHKIYVCKESGKEVAFGLPGRVFLNCTPEQTQNVHRYPPDHRPPCEEAIFSNIWGSFAMPVIEVDTCVGVLEFVMDTPKESYNNDILVVYRALKHAGLDSSIELDHPIRTNINERKRLRKTKSLSFTKYRCLVPYFGLSSAHAAKKLELKQGAFTHLCRNVGIPVWPWIPNATAKASSVPEAQINQIEAESGTNEIAFESTSDIEAWIAFECARPGFMPNFDEMDFSDVCRNVDVPVWPWIPNTTAGVCSLPEAQINQTVVESGTNEIAFQTSDIEAWIESERARHGFMPDFEEMDYQDENDPFIDGLDVMDCLDYDIEELIDQIE